MRKIVALCVCLMCYACSGEKTPVDMSYRVTVQTLENTCDDTSAPDDVTTVVDAFMNGDESVTLVFQGSFIPGESTYHGVVVKDGQVDTRFNKEAVGYQFHHDIKGSLSMEHMNLTLRVTKRKDGDGKFVECHEKVRLQGDARPLWDKTSIDGRYRVQIQNYGKVCPGDNLGTPQIRNAPMDINPARNGLVNISLDESETNTFFDAQISSNGQIEMMGETKLYVIFGGQSYTESVVTVSGNVTPESTDFMIEYLDPENGDGCPYVTMIQGAKVFPNPTVIDNAYRVNYHVNSDCDELVNGTGPYKGEFDMRVEAVLQGEARLDLLEFPWRIPLDLDGHSFSNEYFYNWGEAFITYEGTIEPPFLTYVIDWHFWPGSEYECHHRVEAFGHARFVREGEEISSTSQPLSLPEAITFRKDFEVQTKLFPSKNPFYSLQKIH